MGELIKLESELWIIYIKVKFPDFGNFTVVMKQNVFILKRFTHKYLGVEGHDVSNLLSKDSRKKLHVKIDKI